ncbi:CDT1-like protein a, chloroplastic [Lolium perenne]|uniref:CDT1-like protein a, chloroplastic n=1 Tax=Lolium perenne TaxID=4522 RepID=UPI0021F575DC|nr:CDT1-like protein a, chloroplastic [Lolium perenne]XP_051187842.1 CDT1-like protein a, chloroplastic [Lolium perenne]
MTDGKSAQVDLGEGINQMASDDNSSSPATMQNIKADMEDAGGKMESPTLEKPESEREEIVVSTLATNLLAESYKDILAEKLLGNEDETDDEDDNDNILLPGSSQSSVPNGLLEKHKNLLNIFNRMESSIRLLRLRKKMATFKDIATQVEVLTKRKFLYTHLAQMKHLFPEAIQITRILLHDEKSICMYADMEIALRMDTVECSNSHESPAMAICEAFRSKLLCFLESHHEDIDIPEATLPEPFNSREVLYLDTLHNGHSAQRVLVDSKGELYLDKLHNGHSFEGVLESSSENGFSNSSHFPQSFQKIMSQKSIAKVTKKTQLLSDPVEVTFLGADDTGAPDTSSTKHVSVPAKTNICDTPNRHLISFSEKDTPKQAISHSPLMAETPQMQTPKMPLPTPLGKIETSSRHGSEARSASSARRSLVMFSPSKFDESPSADTSKPDKDGAFVAEDEVIAGKCLFPEETCTFTSILVEKDTDKTNQVPSTNSQEKLDSLRATFDIVCGISGSSKNSLITKQELVHNILANNLDIEETGEIEEQLHILEDLSPEWLSKKLRGGEVLYSIKQIPDQKLVRERLVEVI